MPGKLWVILYQLDSVLLKKLALSLSDKHHPIVLYYNTGGPGLLGSSQYWESH